MKAAIFDLDGTLICSMEAWKGVGAKILHRFGLLPPSNLNEILTPMSLDQACLYLQREYHLPASFEEIRELCSEYAQKAYETRVKSYPFVSDYLQTLQKKKIRCCVATSTTQQLAQTILQRENLLQYFAFVLTDEEVGCGKDKPDIYLQAAEKMGVSIEDCVVFEDAAYAAKTAKQAGFTVYGLLTGLNDRELPEICDQCIHGFAELIVKGI